MFCQTVDHLKGMLMRRLLSVPASCPTGILQRFKPATMVLLGYCLVLFTYEVRNVGAHCGM